MGGSSLEVVKRYIESQDFPAWTSVAGGTVLATITAIVAVLSAILLGSIGV